MAQFMILLYGNPGNWINMSPEEMQQAMQKYWVWGDDLKKTSRLLASHKLVDNEGCVLRGKKEARVTDGPFTEGKEFLGGYYMFTADSFDHAVEISRNHPQLEYGGTVEVRQIHELTHPR